MKLLSGALGDHVRSEIEILYDKIEALYQEIEILCDEVEALDLAAHATRAEQLEDSHASV